jgi:hypothetical protein
MIAHKVVTVAAVAAALCSGCARTIWQVDESQQLTPSSYSIYQSPTSRTIGKLRRILLVNIATPTPEACLAEEPAVLPRAEKYYLQEEKGYDVIDLHEPGDNWSEKEQSALAQLTAAADKTEPHVSARTAESVRELASTERKFDALMLVEAGWSCQNAARAFRWSMTAMTLGMNKLMPHGEEHKLAPRYRATLFETATGRPVWQSNVQHAWLIVNVDLSEPIERQLFQEIEQAVPELLTQ